MSNTEVAQIFDRNAPAYDQVGPSVFAWYGRRVIEALAVFAGARVLDVATGRGAILFPAVAAVGSRGRVVGVDLSNGMLRALAAALPQTDRPSVMLSQMDAENLALVSNAFDFVFCGNSIYYFPQAIHAFHRVLKPGGWVGVTIMARGSLDWMFDLMRPFLPASPAREATEKSVSENLDTSEGLYALLSEAGFKQVQVITEKNEFLYKDESIWWDFMWTLGLRGTLEQMAGPTQERYRASVCEHLQSFKRADGLHIPFSSYFAIGSK